MLLRALDHTPRCPYCRRGLAAQLAAQSLVVDAALQRLAREALPDEYEECASLVAKDRAASARTIPVFVCNAALPTQRCPLHVFEPRYRLMMRRAMQSGGRRFGMCAHTGGQPGWADHGTVLYIKSLRLLPDGRSLVETVGEKRFKVVNRGRRDGYMTAQVTWVDDTPGWAAAPGWDGSPTDGATAAADTTNAAQPPPPPQDGSGSAGAHSVSAPGVSDLDAVQATGTQLLRAVRTWFATRLGLQPESVPFSDDASTFTWWALDKLPVGDNILVAMLSTTTPLDRLRTITSVLQVVERAEGAGGSFAQDSSDEGGCSSDDGGGSSEEEGGAQGSASTTSQH